MKNKSNEDKSAENAALRSSRYSDDYLRAVSKETNLLAGRTIRIFYPAPQRRQKT